MSDNWFSNFKPFDKPMLYGLYRYETPEHFYQAMKTDNKTQRHMIATAHTPGQAKKLGRICDIKPNWNDIKDDYMLYALQYKFRKGTLFNKQLLQTKGLICEWNKWHDNYWGSCTCNTCISIKGKNKLGKMLMSIRLLSKFGIEPKILAALVLK